MHHESSLLRPVEQGAARGIIDIGSNTVRLVIFGGPARAPAVLHNEKVTARLGKGVADNGRLSDKGMKAALTSLARYAAILRLHGVEDVQCVATAAVRDATNGRQFLDQVAALGLSPRLLSGEEEAVSSAHGVISAFPGAHGVVGDLGGGSLELIDIDGERCTHGSSLPLGTLRLPALRDDGGARFSRRVKKMLRSVQWSTAHDQPLYLVGGSFRALARYAMVQQNWPIDDPHGFEMAPEDAIKLARKLTDPKMVARLSPPPAKSGHGKVPAARSMAAKGPAKAALTKAPAKPLAKLPAAKVTQRITIPGVSSARLASLPDAAALLAVLVRELKPQKLIFSSWGLREGLLAEGFDEATRASDPMLAGISAFAAAHHAAIPQLALEMVRWTARALPPSSDPDGPRVQRLRLGATMLSLVSLDTEPNLRLEQGADWALRKRWVGLTARGRAMIALAVAANSGRTAVPPELLRLAPIGVLRDAVVWGLATRLARRLGGGAVMALAGTSLRMAGGELVLAVRPDLAALCSEMVEKDLRVLAECLGLAPRIDILAEGADLP
ncbi:MAG: Ppx/GppA family phosphatase [Sphingomonadales bacterium]|nr:Ppx/GppA family phosphatase [Sphingomonadales bacterium]MDE2168366.1 Ppx/GppA family phosphatase [Sphingomonadales bacterium]